jgi:hypothetical protein
MAAKKKPMRSADASEGASNARRKRATGQSSSSSQDAVTRRYKTTESLGRNYAKGVTSLFTVKKDRLTGGSTTVKRWADPLGNMEETITKTAKKSGKKK